MRMILGLPAGVAAAALRLEDRGDVFREGDFPGVVSGNSQARNRERDDGREQHAQADRPVGRARGSLEG